MPRLSSARRLRTAIITGVVLTALVCATRVTFAQQKPQTAASLQSIEARLKVLEDTDQVRQLLADYIRFVDAEDFASYSQLFTSDGELIFAQNRPKGPEAIRALMERGSRGRDAAAAAAWKGSGHLLTDVSIQLTGDQATASSRWTLITRGKDDRPLVSARGHYSDVLVRDAGRWKFKKRVVYADIPHQDPFETPESSGR
jgi:ketosteroid isomerase-like protein